MSKTIESQVWRSGLKGDLKPLAAVMADMGNDDGQGIYPSVAYLAWLLGASERSVQRGLKQLAALGIITRTANALGGRNLTPRYRLYAAKLPKRGEWKDTRKGDKLTPFQSEKGDKHDIKRVTFCRQKGDKNDQKGDKMTPDPLLEPLVDPLVRTELRASQARAVFDFWKLHLDHPKAKPDSKRLRLIADRLKNGFSVEELCAAVRGCKLTPFNMGDNERQTIFDDIGLICRDVRHVEQFIARAETGETNGANNGLRRPTTAADRNADQLSRNLAVVAELRGAGGRNYH